MAKTCFVIMGFHKKTDFPTGRTLDLDKSYRLLIKPAVDEAGLTCIRADEIAHSGVIDVPMYRHLLDSDLVIADLSTGNPNALYELGVRHALRPFSTIVIAESKLQYPFDVSHTAIRSYQHLGDAIDYEEVIRFRAELTSAIAAIVEKQEKDSPVYTYLPGLRPPGVSAGRGGGGRGSARRSAGVTPDGTPSAAAMVDRADAALERQDYAQARELLTTAHAMRPADKPWTANDDYLVQRLAYATAMSAAPDATTALAGAHQLMLVLEPGTSNNPATVELWGGVAKGLWDHTRDRAHLERAAQAYERAFCLRQSAENGLNYALVLNVRASVSDPAEAIADFVQARRVRRRVVEIGTAQVAAESPLPSPAPPDLALLGARYAVRAALAEGHAGLGERQQALSWRDQAFALGVSEQMKDATAQRLAVVESLTAESPLRRRILHPGAAAVRSTASRAAPSGCGAGSPTDRTRPRSARR
jgi:tetratricopeptide (TPR) repeat protein